MDKTSSIAVQMKEILDEYSEEVSKAVDMAAQEATEATVQQLKRTSPRRVRGKKRGRYARGWTFRKEGVRSYVVFNKTDWQLTHLLENGHDILRGGKFVKHFEGIPHIADAERNGSNEFYIRVSQGLGK